MRTAPPPFVEGWKIIAPFGTILGVTFRATFRSSAARRSSTVAALSMRRRRYLRSFWSVVSASDFCRFLTRHPQAVCEIQ